MCDLSTEKNGVERPTTQGATGVVATAARIVVFRVVSAAGASAVVLVTARRLGAAGRGAFVLQFTVAVFCLAVCSLGVTVSGRVHLVAAEDPVRIGDYLGLSLALTALQAVVCVVLGVTLLPAAGVHLSTGGLLVLGAFGGGALLQYLLTDALNAYGFTVQAAMVEAMGVVAQLALVVVLAVSGQTDVQWFMVALVVAAVFQVVTAAIMLRRRRAFSAPRYDAASWRRLVVTGLPAMAGLFAPVMAFRVDRYIIGLFLTPAAVGVYSVASTAPEFLRLLPIAVAQPILHRLASGSAEVADFRPVRALCVGITMLLAGITFLIAPVAIDVLFGPEFAAAVTPLRILLLAELGMTFFYVDGSSLVGLGRISHDALAATLGLVVVVVADFLLIPSHGIVGAAWASVIAYSLMGLVAHVLLRRGAAAVAPTAVLIEGEVL